MERRVVKNNEEQTDLKKYQLQTGRVILFNLALALASHGNREGGGVRGAKIMNT